MLNIYYTIITGASEGLGRSLAVECASRKMNLILVSLPESGLWELASFIRRNFGVTVEIYEMDLSETASCYHLKKEISTRRLRVRMLINNAGVGGTHGFDEQSSEFYEKQIRLNVLSTTILTRLFVEELEKSSPSYIMNVGSLASFFIIPNKQVYAGTKAFIYSFSKSLRAELVNEGISVSVLCPGGLNTTLKLTLMHRNASRVARLSVMNPQEVAILAIDGLLNGKDVIIPGKINYLLTLINSITPGFIKNMVMQKYLSSPGGSKPALYTAQ